MRGAVFLDRDGVVTQSITRDGKPFAPTELADFAILPGVPQAVARLKQAGFALVVVTNQPDVGRGQVPQAIIEAMHAELMARLPLDAVKVCYTASDNEGCLRRKPQPGMLLEAAAEFGVDLARSYMVGDRWRDMSAGCAAGCHTIFIDYGYDEKSPDHYDHRTDSLAAATDYILAQKSAAPRTPGAEKTEFT